jgi:hypothetical protein
VRGKLRDERCGLDGPVQDEMRSTYVRTNSFEAELDTPSRWRSLLFCSFGH